MTDEQIRREEQINATGERGYSASGIRNKQDAVDHLESLGVSRDKLIISQIKTLLAPLKRQGDKALPTLKVDLQRQLVEWEARGYQLVNKVVYGVVGAATNELQQARNEESELVEDVEHPYVIEQI